MTGIHHRYVTTIDGFGPRPDSCTDELEAFLSTTPNPVFRHTCVICSKSMTDPEMIADGNKYGGRHFTPDCPGRTVYDLLLAPEV